MGVQTVEGRRSRDVVKREWLRACLAEENDFWRLPQAGVPHSQVGKGVEIKRGKLEGMSGSCHAPTPMANTEYAKSETGEHALLSLISVPDVEC